MLQKLQFQILTVDPDPEAAEVDRGHEADLLAADLEFHASRIPQPRDRTTAGGRQASADCRIAAFDVTGAAQVADTSHKVDGGYANRGAEADPAQVQPVAFATVVERAAAAAEAEINSALNSRNSMRPDAASACDEFMAVNTAGAKAKENSACNRCRREWLTGRGAVGSVEGVFDVMGFPSHCFLTKLPKILRENGLAWKSCP